MASRLPQPASSPPASGTPNPTDPNPIDPNLVVTAPVDLLVGPGRRAVLREVTASAPRWPLGPRQLCDLDLLLTGAFSPLRGFLGREDHESVCQRMRLADGTLWPIPITLDVPGELARRLAPGDPLVLVDATDAPLAVLHVEDRWCPDRREEARSVFRTTSLAHPGVAHLLERTHPWYVGGRLEGLRRPPFPDLGAPRPGPLEVRAELARRGWDRVVAFHTRNPLHRAHYELTRRAAEEADAHLLLHPVTGPTKPGDVDAATRVRCYRAIMPHYPPGLALLALLPMAMRLSGPRDSLWNALVRRNFGCTHYAVGREHASPGPDVDGTPFYGPYEAQEILVEHASELGMTSVPFPMLVYVPSLDRYLTQAEVPPGREARPVSGTLVRALLERGEEIPEWITFPEVATELRRAPVGPAGGAG